MAALEAINEGTGLPRYCAGHG